MNPSRSLAVVCASLLLAGPAAAVIPMVNLEAEPVFEQAKFGGSRPSFGSRPSYSGPGSYTGRSAVQPSVARRPVHAAHVSPHSGMPAWQKIVIGLALYQIIFRSNSSHASQPTPAYVGQLERQVIQIYGNPDAAESLLFAEGRLIPAAQTFEAQRLDAENNDGEPCHVIHGDTLGFVSAAGPGYKMKIVAQSSRADAAAATRCPVDTSVKVPSAVAKDMALAFRNAVMGAAVQADQTIKETPNP